MVSERYRVPEFHSLTEQFFGLNRDAFRSRFGINENDLLRYTYSPLGRDFKPENLSSPRGSREVLFCPEAATLIVPSCTFGPIGIRDLAAMTIPVVGFIDAVKPDIVIGCDRGARLYAVAVHSMWGHLRQRPFPTLDRALHFAHLSTKLDIETTANTLAEIINASFTEAKNCRRRINGSKTSVIFIDDWIHSGATRELILNSLAINGFLSTFDVKFAVMCGAGANATGSPTRVKVNWQDDPKLIGVAYTNKNRAIPVREAGALHIRRKIHKETRALALKRKGKA